MKTSTLRNAVSIALAMATGTVGLATAQEAATEAATAIRPPEESARPEDHSIPAHPPTTTSSAEPAPTELGKITVTGTRIRGGTTPSPVVTIGSERIREEGFADLGEVVRSLPQNFGGGQNPGVLMGNVAGGGLANQNVTGGASLNLRGLGPDATLTLLNGRRMSYGGFVQAVDISAIPVEAVQRIEIIADGASAIYGSDAVAGVGNVILKQDYEGVSVGARYGGATDGGLATREYTATAGATWPTGGLIATYKDVGTDPIRARQRRYTAHLPEPSTLYPGSDLRSGLVSAHQALGSRVHLQVDALRTEREQAYDYYFGNRLTYNALTPETTTTFVSPSVAFDVGTAWVVSAGGAWGRDEYINRHALVAAATGVSTPYLHECFCNKSRNLEAGAEGPLFELGGGDARLAIGAGHRRNEFLWKNYATGAAAVEGEQGSRFAYAELNLPLMDTGTRRLEATAAARWEDYDSFGSVSTPKLGLVYGPSADFTLKASWGRSFKAPTLFQTHRPQVAQLVLARPFGGAGYAADDALLIFAGGNPDLRPERARTWSTSLAFHPEALPGFEAELTWFDVDYTERVVEPIGNYFEALSNPMYAEFLHWNPSPERQAAVIAAAASFLNGTGLPYDPGRVVALLDGRYVNATRQRIKGADLSGSYRFDLGAGQLVLRGAASWLDSTQRTAGAPAPHDLAGTTHHPAKFNGRAGAVWSQGGLTASAFANVTGGVTNPSDGRKGASFTTVDATLRYATQGTGGLWSGLEFELAATNLLDRDPPLYTPISPEYVAPYDSTNYSAIGRFLSLSVSRRW